MAWAFALFGIPFVLIGLGMMLAPFWAARKARQTAYILTDRRFLTICAGHATTVKSIDPSRIVATEATRHADGSGHINMTLGFARDGDGGTETTSEKLWAVPAVARLEALLREFRRAQS